MHRDEDENGRRARNAVHAELRQRTRDDHEAVDAAFARFDLSDRDDYAAFLGCHARVLPALEAALDPAALVSGWVGRSEALLNDLDALGAGRPAAPPIDLPQGEAARWGALYVLEGSRLGGAFVARQVGEGLPKAYLSAAHAPGGWQRILAAIEAAAEGPEWIDAAVVGARRAFAAFGAVAQSAKRAG